MAGFRIEGDTSGTCAEVNLDKEQLVALTKVIAKSGFAALVGETDGGAVTGTRTARALEVTEDYRLRVSTDMPTFSEYFPGTALNTSIWQTPTGTMTVTVAGGFLTLNAGLNVASATYAQLRTWRSFPVYGTYTTYAEMILQASQAPLAGNVSEWGLFIGATTAAPTDGAFFRLTSTGELRCVVSTGGVETTSPLLDFNALIGVTNSRHYVVGVNQDAAEFWIEDALVAVVKRAASGPGVIASPEVPIAARTYNTAGTAAAQTLKISHACVTLSGLGTSGKPWSHIRAGAGDNAAQTPTGQTPAQTAIYANSNAGTAATAPSNTTTISTGLGGQTNMLLTAAVEIDGSVIAYQVPVGSATVPGKTLYITGVRIQSVVTVTAAGGPFIFQWGLAYGHTSVSLATAEAATTKAPRRIPLGFQTFAANAAQGVRDDRDIDVLFETPIVVQPGEFVAAFVKNIGVIGTAGALRVIVAINGYFE